MLGSTRNDYDALEVAHAQKTSAANAHLLRKQWLEVGLLSEVRQPLTQSRQPDVPTKQRRAYTILIHIDAHSARIRLGRYCKPTAAASKTGATNLPTRTVPSCSSNGHSCDSCNQTQLRTNAYPLRCANPLSEFSFDSPQRWQLRHSSLCVRESVHVGVTPSWHEREIRMLLSTKLGSFARVADCVFLCSSVSFETISLSTPRLSNACHIFSLYPACRCRQLVSAADAKLEIPNEALHQSSCCH